jgi:metallo-beta-lactamase family protein
MKLTFHGGVGMVTGANYLLESGDTKILVDCGLMQGSNFCERMNWDEFPYKPSEISAVFITHAHIDHTGRLPKLYRDGFRGAIYSTPPTRDFAEQLLLDSEHVLANDAKKLHKPQLYYAEDVMGAMSLWQGLEYHKFIEVGPFKIQFYNAGHILGSSIIVIEAEGKKIAFSGDLGNSPAPIIGDTEKLHEADYAVVESTYGDRLHEETPMRREVLEDMIEDVVKMKGVLMIPAFAMERTQEMLYEINSLVEQGRIPRVPIFIDSPLAIKLTAVYKKYVHYYDAMTRAAIAGGDAIFNFPGLHMTLTTEESKSINDVPPPKVIIAGSGMSNGGRILHHESRYLSDPNSLILFIGYQARGTLGRQILDGEKTVKIFGEEVVVNCKVKSVPGYSAHADQAQLVAWLYPLRRSIKKLFVTQGESGASEALAQKVRDELAMETAVPEKGESYELL